MQNKKFINVQVLRALAAGLVVYVHAISTYESKIFNNGWSPETNFGDIGVKLFFCISGFIIFKSTSKLQGGFDSSLEFFAKRCVRIVPLYWLASSIYALKLILQGNPPAPENFLRSLLFIPYAAQDGLMRPVLGQGWTLNFEMWFYILATLFLLSRSRLRYHWLMAGLATAVLINGWLPVATERSFFDISLVTTELLFFFVSGIAVAMYAAKNSRPLPVNFFGKLPPLMVALVMLVMALAASSMLEPTVFKKSIFWLEWLCCTFAVFAATVPNAGIQNALPLPLQLAASAGDGSYSTYLLHGFVMGPAARLLSLSGVDIPMQVFALLMVFVCTLVGVLCYRYFELPVQRAFYKAWSPKAKNAETFPLGQRS